MTTIADFRPSVSQMSEDELLTHIRTIRALRRMIPEKVKKKSRKKSEDSKKNKTVKSHLEDLGENERQAMAQLLLKLRYNNDRY